MRGTSHRVAVYPETQSLRFLKKAAEINLSLHKTSAFQLHASCNFSETSNFASFEESLITITTSRSLCTVHRILIELPNSTTLSTLLSSFNVLLIAATAFCCNGCTLSISIQERLLSS